MGNKQSLNLSSEVNIGHFKLLQIIGKGAFGVVRVVQKRITKEKYALKYISKEKCIRKKMVKNIIRERLILELVNNPFIINLQYAFQDDRHLFFIIDLAEGGDLRFHLNRIGCLSLATIKIYSAELSSAIHYLHSLKIVHRDIKPENLLLDERGHIHLTDFNVAILLEEKIPTSKSGTTAYMAPEQFISKPYTYSVDWWALGIVLFECTFSAHPFAQKTSMEKSITISENLFRLPPKTRQLQFKFQKSMERQDFLSRLLEKSPEKRLGCNGFDEIKNHEWLKEINWELLDAKLLTPDFVPDATKNNNDFNAALEDLLYESDPLNTKPVVSRKPKKDRTLLLPSLSLLWNDKNNYSIEDDLDYLDKFFPSYSKPALLNSFSVKKRNADIRSSEKPLPLIPQTDRSSSLPVFQERKSSLTKFDSQI